MIKPAGTEITEIVVEDYAGERKCTQEVLLLLDTLIQRTELLQKEIVQTIDKHGVNFDRTTRMAMEIVVSTLSSGIDMIIERHNARVSVCIEAKQRREDGKLDA